MATACVHSAISGDPVTQVRLEQPTLRRADEFVRSVRRSRELHRGLVSPPNTREKFQQYVRGLRQKNRDGFFVSPADSDDIVGVVNVNEIVRGSFQSAYLGYYAFVPFAGLGLMHRGLELTIDYCFKKSRLHRLEANIQPENERSISLIRGLGFRLEGLSLRYLKVCGQWQDHQRWAILAEEWRKSKRIMADEMNLSAPLMRDTRSLW